jgi:choline dehydrogenase-like flavoprotein
MHGPRLPRVQLRGLRTRDRATLAAIAEAVVPDDGGALPGAGPGGVDAAAAVSRFLAGVPERQRALVVLALRAVEWVSGARRFSRLEMDGRVRRLERLSANPLGRDLVLLLKALVSFGWARDSRVQAGLGINPGCAVRPGTPDPVPDAAPLQRADLALPDVEVEHCDVAIVGSGAGGATAARILAERGLDVVVLEEGHLYDSSTYTTDPLTALGRLYRDGGLTVLEGRPAIPLPLGRCVGGTTVINSGTCVRTPGDVLVRWRDECGLPWATEIDDEFEAIERDLAVTGLDPRSAGPNAAVCRRGADAIGAANHGVLRNAGQVARCGTCPTGCAIDAKQAMHVSELPRAAAAGARIRSGARAEKIIVQGGRAAGVVVQRDDGRPYAVSARAVVIAAGAIGTPELLLRQGLGAPGTGRNLHVQPACWVGGLFDEEVRGWEGVMQSWHVDEWRSRGLFLEATFTPLPFGAHWLPGLGRAFKERVEQIGRLAVIGVHLADRSPGRVRVRGGRARLGYHLTAEDASTLGFGIARAADILFAAGAREVYPQVAGIQAIAPGRQSRLEAGVRPAQLRLEAFHPMGTARIGADTASVVAPDGQLRALPGLYVADGSLLPTALGVNPMITILAAARRVARDLADRLG